MSSYIGQTKTPTGVIFHYMENKEDHIVDSTFYTNEEMKVLGWTT